MAQISKGSPNVPNPSITSRGQNLEKERKIKMKAIILNNPLIQHKLSIIRNKKTGTKEFREIIGEIATFYVMKQWQMLF